MKIFEIENEMLSFVRLGERMTFMCFMRINDAFQPAVLCVKTEMQNNYVYFTKVSGILYWDESQKSILREDIEYTKQEQAGLPAFAGVIEEEAAAKTFNEKQYYELLEVIWEALNHQCVTENMKKQYDNIVLLNDFPELKKVYKFFFSDAIEVLYG